MRGHFGIFFSDSEQIGGCLSWAKKEDTYHTSNWFLLKDMKEFLIDLYQIDDDEPELIETQKVKLNCSHRINLNYWSRGAITLQQRETE